MTQSPEDQKQAIFAELADPQPLTDKDQADMEWLKDEYALLGGIGMRAPDWEGMETRSRPLVAKTMNLSVFGYLSSAWVMRHKLPGLVATLELLAHLLEKHGESLKPHPRFQTRILGGTETFLGKHLDSLKSDDGTLLARAVDAAKQTKTQILERYENPPGDFTPIRRKLEEWLKEAPAPAAEAKPAEEAAQPAEAEHPAPVEAKPEPAAAPDEPAPEPKAEEKPAEPKEKQEESPLIAKPLAPFFEQSVIDKLLKPISDDKPAGDSPNKHDDFEDIKDEIAKTGAIGSSGPNWDLIENKSIELLSGEGKSLFLTAFLGATWVEKHKLAGIVAALELNHDVIFTFWDTLPSRVKARSSALRWLHQWLNKKLDKAREENRALLQRAEQGFSKLRSLLLDKYEDPPCDFMAMRNKVREWIDQLPAEKPEPPPKAEAPKQEATPEQPKPAPSAPAPASNASAAPTSELGDISEAKADALYPELARIATRLQELDPADPTAALLLRRVYWRTAKQPPEKNRKTMIPAPPKQVQTSLETMKKNAAWDRILAKAEDYAQRFIYWLDLQCLSAEAAGHLDNDVLKQLIEAETIALVDRVPKLLELQFKDGLPFASEETQAWLKKARQTSTPGGGPIEDDPVDDLQGELTKAGADGFTDALANSKHTIQTALNAREAFRMKLAVGKYCLSVDQTHVAEGLAESLSQEALKQNLGYWEPELAAGAWALLIDVCRKHSIKDPYYVSKERDAMRHLADLDLDKAAGFPKRAATGR